MLRLCSRYEYLLPGQLYYSYRMVLSYDVTMRFLAPMHSKHSNSVYGHLFRHTFCMFVHDYRFVLSMMYIHRLLYHGIRNLPHIRVHVCAVCFPYIPNRFRCETTIHQRELLIHLCNHCLLLYQFASLPVLAHHYPPHCKPCDCNGYKQCCGYCCFCYSFYPFGICCGVHCFVPPIIVLFVLVCVIVIILGGL